MFRLSWQPAHHIIASPSHSLVCYPYPPPPFPFSSHLPPLYLCSCFTLVLLVAAGRAKQLRWAQCRADHVRVLITLSVDVFCAYFCSSSCFVLVLFLFCFVLFCIILFCLFACLFVYSFFFCLSACLHRFVRMSMFVRFFRFLCVLAVLYYSRKLKSLVEPVSDCDRLGLFSRADFRR